MRENVLITTGGSGGHVIPAMILYDHLSNYTHVTISTDRRGSRFLDKDNVIVQRALRKFRSQSSHDVVVAEINMVISLPLNSKEIIVK